MPRRLRSWTGVSSLTLLWCAACGSPPPADPDKKATFAVNGKVLLDGQALPAVTVVLHPRDAAGDKALRSYGKTDASGSFTLSTYQAGDGAPAGHYTVTVHGDPDAAVAAAVPDRYARTGSSGLQVEVKQQANDLPPFQLRR